MSKHKTHTTRFSDSSRYDEVCIHCGETDVTGGGWGKLAEPCPAVTTISIDHRIKSWPQFYHPMITGIKKHDMRNMRDRDYRVGQVLLLQEYDPFLGGYTGREATFRITYITSNTTPCALSSAALANDFAILSLEFMAVCSDPTAGQQESLALAAQGELALSDPRGTRPLYQTTCFPPFNLMMDKAQTAH